MHTWIHNTPTCGAEAGERIRIKTHTSQSSVLPLPHHPRLMVLELGTNGKLGRMTWIQGAYTGVKPRTHLFLSSQELGRFMRAEIRYGDVGYIKWGSSF